MITNRIARSFAALMVPFAVFASGCVADAEIDMNSVDETEETNEASQAMNGTIVTKNVAAFRPVTAIGTVEGNPAKVTDGVFANEGHWWYDGNYAARIKYTTPASGVQIELDRLYQIHALVLQADGNDKYRVDGSEDGQNWATLHQFTAGAGVGLRTRPRAVVNSMLVRYLRVIPSEGNNAYSISELQAEATYLQCGNQICDFDEYCTPQGTCAWCFVNNEWIC